MGRNSSIARSSRQLQQPAVWELRVQGFRRGLVDGLRAAKLTKELVIGRRVTVHIEGQVTARIPHLEACLSAQPGCRVEPQLWTPEHKHLPQQVHAREFAPKSKAEQGAQQTKPRCPPKPPSSKRAQNPGDIKDERSGVAALTLELGWGSTGLRPNPPRLLNPRLPCGG